jgi:hypothetical protein
VPQTGEKDECGANQKNQNAKEQQPPSGAKLYGIEENAANPAGSGWLRGNFGWNGWWRDIGHVLE